MSRSPIGVIRPGASTLAAWPRPRLRPALEGAVSAVERRLARLGRRLGDHPIALVWGRFAPLTVLRQTRVQQSWHVTPELFVQLSAAAAAAAPRADRGAPERAPRADDPPLPSMLLATVEQRLETRIVGHALAALAAPAQRSSSDAHPIPPPTGAQPPAVPARARVLPVPAPLHFPEMVVARAPAATAAAPAPPAPAHSASAAALAERGAGRAAAIAPEVRIDRITTEVMRALDARLIAWRERMGRP